MECKTLFLDAKPDADADTLEGYASVKNEVDAVGDLIRDGAYGNLNDFVRQGFVTVGHDHSANPIGFIEQAREDSHGLFVSMKFHSTPAAQEAKAVAFERLRAGRVVGLSIGYLPVDWEFERQNGKRIRVLKKIELKEFSLVAMPAMVKAQATRVGPSMAELAALENFEALEKLTPAWTAHQSAISN